MLNTRSTGVRTINHHMPLPSPFYWGAGSWEPWSRLLRCRRKGQSEFAGGFRGGCSPVLVRSVEEVWDVPETFGNQVTFPEGKKDLNVNRCLGFPMCCSCLEHWWLLLLAVFFCILVWLQLADERLWHIWPSGELAKTCGATEGQGVYGVPIKRNQESQGCLFC